jgi:hypothetical protein
MHKWGQARLITHFKGRRILRLHFAPIIDTCCRNIRVAQPLLHLGDVGFVVKSIGGGRDAQGMRADLRPQRQGIVAHEFINAIRCDRVIELAGAVVVAFAVDPQVRHAAAGVNVLDVEATQFFAAQAVVEERGEQRTIAQALEALVVRQVHQLASFLVGNRRRLALVIVDLGTLNPLDGVRRHGVLVGREFIQRRQRRELAADGSQRELPAIEVLAPGDYVGTGDQPQFLWRPDAGEAHEFF